MSVFNQVSQEAIENVQVNAGMILKNFNPTTPAAPEADDIVCATTGGITATCTPSFADFGADIDNCPNDVKEMKRITGYTCTLAFTALNITADMIKLSLGAASAFTKEIQARTEINNADFTDIWFVSEKVNNTVVAICLKDALSTGGFSLKTSKNEKGQLAVTLTGHVSLTDPDKVPMSFYVCEAPRATGTSLYDDEP